MKLRQPSHDTGEVMGVAWFITPHGFGHAARAAAVMNACTRRRATLRHHLFTTVEEGFFTESLGDENFGYHRLECDLGMVQRTSLDEDVAATVRALDRLADGPWASIDRLAQEVRRAGCVAVVSDIAPLGLAVADRLSVPGVLVENFTWDWIYGAYGDPGLRRHGEQMARWFRGADLLIQTDPCCRARSNAHRVPPMSRRVQRSGTEIRRQLGIPEGHRVILISMSGAGEAGGLPPGFRPPSRTTVVVPRGGGSDPSCRSERVVAAHGLYHPDLVAASDLVVAKLGYSTVAEVYHACTALAYLRRPRFRESPVLEAFVREHIPSEVLPPGGLEDPEAPAVLERLLDIPCPRDPRPNGAAAAAELILDLLDRQT